MSSIRSNVHEHLRWALTKAGADLVQVSTNYTRGGTDLYVRVGASGALVAASNVAALLAKSGYPPSNA